MLIWNFIQLELHSTTQSERTHPYLNRLDFVVLQNLRQPVGIIVFVIVNFASRTRNYHEYKPAE